LAKDKEALQAKYNAAVASQDEVAIQKTGTDVTTKAIAIRNMETEAMAQDEKAIEAKEKLDVAQKEMKTLDDEVEAYLTTDPDYAAIQQQVVQAETELKQQEDQQKAATAAASQAAAAASRARSASKPRPSKSGGDY
jgi:hypothetical protein